MVAIRSPGLERPARLRHVSANLLIIPYSVEDVHVSVFGVSMFTPRSIHISNAMFTHHVNLIV